MFHPTSRSVSTDGSFHRSKTARAYSWPLTSIACRSSEWVELYAHSPRKNILEADSASVLRQNVGSSLKVGPLFRTSAWQGAEHFNGCIMLHASLVWRREKIKLPKHIFSTKSRRSVIYLYKTKTLEIMRIRYSHLEENIQNSLGVLHQLMKLLINRSTPRCCRTTHSILTQHYVEKSKNFADELITLCMGVRKHKYVHVYVCMCLCMHLCIYVLCRCARASMPVEGRDYSRFIISIHGYMRLKLIKKTTTTTRINIRT